MALIECKECGTKISDKALICVQCGQTPAYSPLKGLIIHHYKEIQRKRRIKKAMIITLSVLTVLAVSGILTLYYAKPNTFNLLFNRNAIAFEKSKIAYEKLSSVQETCESVMNDIYGAWQWGIYDYDDDKSYDELWEDLLDELSIAEADLEKGMGIEDGAKSTGASRLGIYMILTDKDKRWGIPVEIVKDGYAVNGTHDRMKTQLAEAKAALKSVSEANDDYQYYPTLKQYYSRVSSYSEFIQNPTGSFEQLASTITEYENTISTYSEDLSFVFED